MKDSDCLLMTESSERNLSGQQLMELLEGFLRDGTACRLKARGSSMTPFIRHGDVVEIEPSGPVIRTGQVVAASDQGGKRVLVHRVVRVRDSNGGIEYMLSGDSGKGSEDWVSPGRILGVVRAVWRDGSRVFVGGKILGPIAVRLAGFIRRLRGRNKDAA